MKLSISAPNRHSPTHRRGEAADEAATVLLSEQGAYLAPGQSGWQFGDLKLTADRLRFVQPRGVLFDVPLAGLLGVALERKHYMIVRKPAMAITYQDPRRHGLSTAYFLTPLLGQWMARLTQIVGGAAPESTQPRRQADVRSASSQIGVRQDVSASRSAADAGVLRPPPGTTHTGTQPPIADQELERISKQLDPASRALLAYLTANSRASIRELAAQIEAWQTAAGDMQVIFCIQQHINPTAQALLGRPILFFVESQFDRVTGEPVTFQWWLAGRPGRLPHWREVEAEVYDEGDEFLVVIDLTGVDEEAIDCELASDHLTVRSLDPQHVLCSMVDLPAPVAPESILPRFSNGILSIHLRKVSEEN